MNLEHINIVAPRKLIEVEKRFYIDIFGLKVGFRPEFARPGYWLYSGACALIHLTVNNGHHGFDSTGYLDHVAFQSAGLKNLINKLNERNIEYSTEQLSEISMTQIFLKSPIGIRIEVNFINE